MESIIFHMNTMDSDKSDMYLHVLLPRNYVIPESLINLNPNDWANILSQADNYLSYKMESFNSIKPAMSFKPTDPIKPAMSFKSDTLPDHSDKPDSVIIPISELHSQYDCAKTVDLYEDPHLLICTIC